MGLNVLSLFDGMSCGQIALNRLGIKYDNYYASEIDKHAIKVTQSNYPNTIQLGDVRNIKASDLPQIGMLCGGSPCQSFSFAGKRKGMTTKDEIEILSLQHYLQLKQDGFEFEGQSYLFWEYMRLKKELNPKYFLLENVEMGTKWEDVLNKAIGVRGVHINSALVSAQNRRRIYWTNIGLKPVGLFGDLESTITQPIDKGILLKDVLEKDVHEKYYLSQKMIDGLINRPKEYDTFRPILENSESKSKYLIARLSKMGSADNYIKIDKNGNVKNNQDKASCFTAGGHSGGNHSDMDLIAQIVASRGRGDNNEQTLGPRGDNKTNCLTSVQKDNLVAIGLDIRDNELRYRDGGKTGTLCARARNDESCGQLVQTNIINTLEKSPCLHGFEHGSNGQLNKKLAKSGMIRRLTPIECERLQTVPENYTNHVSDTQRYKMLGNGWTVDVICHILNYIA